MIQPASSRPPAPSPDGEALRLEAVTKRFGGLVAVDGVTLSLGTGEVLGLIGPNGSGKTTLLNTINGVHRADSGSIELNGAPIVGMRPHQLVSMGMARTFQTPRVFATLTLTENMLIPLSNLSLDPEARERAYELLQLVGLDRLRGLAASELSGGQQKLLEFARALMNRPRVVLMDEPFAGVHPEIKRTLFARIAAARDSGTSFVVVSHEIPELMGISDRVMCMSYGTVIAEGAPAEVSRDAQVIEAYLGHPKSRGSDAPGGEA